jgi:hypothetical protein
MFDFIILQIWNEYDNKVRTMKRYLVLPMFVLGSIMPLFISTPALAQDAPYSEGHMAQHDGGDRAEYLQEMEHSDPAFYVPPVKNSSNMTTNDNVPAN